jgi:hypothetical protein
METDQSSLPFTPKELKTAQRWEAFQGLVLNLQYDGKPAQP